MIERGILSYVHNKKSMTTKEELYERVPIGRGADLEYMCVTSGVCSSKSEFKRMKKQNAIHYNGIYKDIEPMHAVVLVGKKRLMLVPIDTVEALAVLMLELQPLKYAKNTVHSGDELQR